MNSPVNRNDREISPEIASFLAEARRLQIDRIESAFRSGWRLPAGVCKKYWELYLARRLSDEGAAVAYLELYSDFVSEIERAGGFPDAWTAIDPMAVFGEICSGQRTDDGITCAPASRTLH